MLFSIKKKSDILEALVIIQGTFRKDENNEKVEELIADIIEKRDFDISDIKDLLEEYEQENDEKLFYDI